jgi:hypothetical protein
VKGGAGFSASWAAAGQKVATDKSATAAALKGHASRRIMFALPTISADGNRRAAVINDSAIVFPFSLHSGTPNTMLETASDRREQSMSRSRAVVALPLLAYALKFTGRRPRNPAGGSGRCNTSRAPAPGPRQPRTRPLRLRPSQAPHQRRPHRRPATNIFPDAPNCPNGQLGRRSD